MYGPIRGQRRWETTELLSHQGDHADDSVGGLRLGLDYLHIDERVLRVVALKIFARIGFWFSGIRSLSFCSCACVGHRGSTGSSLWDCAGSPLCLSLTCRIFPAPGEVRPNDHDDEVPAAIRADSGPRLGRGDMRTAEVDGGNTNSSVWASAVLMASLGGVQPGRVPCSVWLELPRCLFEFTPDDVR